MRRAIWTVTILLVLLPSCTPTYSLEDLDNGVPLAVEDPQALVVSAALVTAENLDLHIELEGPPLREQFATSDPGGGYDYAVAYIVSPFCGVPPAVSVRQRGSVEITITPQEGGNCEDIRYTEVVAIDFTVEPNPVSVRVVQE